jgi:UDP-N-acetylmuramoyl-tripeptide--D-alanyl-D-alanine ligase
MITIADLNKLSKVKIINEKLIKKTSFNNVSIDSRKVTKSSLFIAVKGEKFDGHDFTAQVFKKGVKCAIVSRKWYNGLSEIKKRSLNKHAFAIIPDTLKALGSLANIHRNKFLIPVLAIGGANGKTTVKDYIAHVLSQRYNVLKTEGNYNNAFGVPLTLFRMADDHALAVIEVGTNHFGEIKYLCSIANPQLGLITNIGREHLEFFKTVNGAAKAEFELVDYLSDNFGLLFLNSDDDKLAETEWKYSINTISFGSKRKADVSGKLIRFDGFNPVIEINCGKVQIRTKLMGIGKQSFNAALAAAAVGFYFEVPASKIKKAISEYTIESGKRNQLKQLKGINIIDDSYNSNPDSVKAALENLKSYKIKGKKYIVLGDMLELGSSGRKEHYETGSLVKKMGFNHLLTFGKGSYHTYKGAKGVKNNFHFEDKSVLAEMLKLELKKGDLVLVKGSRAMKMEEVIERLGK